MIVTISEELEKFMDNVTRFIDKNYANPLFWIILLVIIITITFIAINKFSEK